MPDVGFDPGSPGSRPGPKAGAKPLRHPGIPFFFFKIFFFYLFKRHTQRGRDIGRRRNRLPAGSPMQDSIPEPQHHDLSQRQTFNHWTIQASHVNWILTTFLNEWWLLPWKVADLSISLILQDLFITLLSEGLEQLPHSYWQVSAPCLVELLYKAAGGSSQPSSWHPQ